MSTRRPDAPTSNTPSAETPPETTPPRLSPPKDVAGGIPAITSTLRHSLGEMGAARSLHTLLRVNQKNGFDCPGCAWPDPDDRRALVEFCENGAKAVAEEATRKRVGPDFFRRWSIPELLGKSDHWLGKQGRLTHPMWKPPDEDHYRPLSWDDAFERIAAVLGSLDSPDEAVFYTSGRASNEAAFLYQLFVRLFGTNNLPDCSNLCHESSGIGLKETIGVSKGTVTLDDFDHADTMVVIGQNPGTNHPRMLTALQRAARRGAKIVSINPLPEAGLFRFKHPQDPVGMLGRGTPISTLYLQVRVNGDVALLKGIMKEILEEDDRRGGTVVDHDFLREKTEGFEAFADDLRAESWEIIARESGISREAIREAAETLMAARRLIVCWAMGLTQHRNAVANVQEIVNLLCLGGHFGRDGAGACPVRGHSNVQGDRTVGIWERPTAEFLDRLGEAVGFEPPRRHGLDTVHAIEAMAAGRVKSLLALGGNFLSATPDTARTATALGRLRLTAHVSTKLNRSHLVTGEEALILPCLGRTERDIQASGPQFVTVENSMGIVHSSRGRLRPASEHLRSEVAIVCGLARATLRHEPAHPGVVDWDALRTDYDRIRDLIERSIAGFTDYNRRVREPGGFYLPNPVRGHGEFPTPSGRARLTVHPIPRSGLTEDQYLLTTIRSHDQYNTTVYGLEDRYRGITGGRRVLLMNAEDIQAAGLRPEGKVDVTSHFQGEERTAHRFTLVPYPIPRRCVAAYFPEANVLVPLGSRAEKSHTPASKSVVVTVRSSG